ncbi:hypothetical protein ACFYU8_18305 [Brevibacillus sp. NPDC003359]|uniref:hypothetical protein n=1 Tax=unclassified Brevibacillus TaxID=2684853 RepID=UPI0036CDD21D
MDQLMQSKMKVSEMQENQEYIFTNWFFSNRANETTVIKKDNEFFYVTYRGGEFQEDQTVKFDDSAFDWVEYNINIPNLLLEDIEEASVILYELFMSKEPDICESVQVI